VTLLSQFISRRLQIRLANESGDSNKPIEHVWIVYNKLANLNLFTRILIESNLKKNDKIDRLAFFVPDNLKKYYLEFKN
jgi:hypothetical protein